MSISYYARRLAALESKYKEAIESLQWYANIQSNCDLIEDGGDLAGRTLKYLARSIC